MKKEYEEVFLNEYGYYELKRKPSAAERKRTFEEQYYQQSQSTYEQHYSEEELQFRENKLYQKELMLCQNRQGDLKGGALLDIGCGEGFVLRYFHDRGMKVTGIDFSEWAVRHHNPEMLPFFLQGDCARILPELMEQKRQFHVINIDSALDMMLEPARIIGLCRGLLAENGLLLVKVANNYSRLQRTLLEDGLLSREYWLDNPGHPSYFNRDGLCRFMADQGFDCVDFYGESFIDLNLLNEQTNYYEHPETGKSCYQAKLALENMLHEISPEKALEVFRLLGEMGFGREIIGIFTVRAGAVDSSFVSKGGS